MAGRETDWDARRMRLRSPRQNKWGVLAGVLVAMTLASGCSAQTSDATDAGADDATSGNGVDAEATTGEADAILAELPDYYPDDYGDLITASQDEDGLVIHGSISNEEFEPLISAFNGLYPWIEIRSLDLPSTELFERYYAEASTSGETADILLSTNADQWVRFYEREAGLSYESAEAGQLPDFATEHDYHLVSTDPYGIIYNPDAFPDGDSPPTSLEDIVELAQSDPDYYNGRIATYSAEAAYARWWLLADAHGDELWTWLEEIGPMIRPETSGGTMGEKTLAGEYAVSFGVPLSVLDPAGVLEWVPASDGTPVAQRAQAITATASNPNSAKLWVDFVLSDAGQRLIPAIERVPFRGSAFDAVVENGDWHLQSLIEDVGEDALLQGSPDPRLLEDYDRIVERWNDLVFGS